MDLKWNKVFIGIFRSTVHGLLRFSPSRLTGSCSFGYGFKTISRLPND